MITVKRGMESRYIAYDYLRSFERINAIIAASDNSFEELDHIPPRDKLTFTNGFYVNCSALFVDIRGSSELPNQHRRPKLAKLYRAYLSEVVAIMCGNPQCAEISIIGDCVAGILDTRTKPHIDCVFSTAAQITSLIDVLNCKFELRRISPITVGIGMSWGRALMIKAGFSGSTINDVVWMGDVVNEASKLCSYGNKDYGDMTMMVSNDFYFNLCDDYKNMLSPNYKRHCYHGNVANVAMSNWYEENCK
ncbi:MAG: adenylate/guanylate cyclase domain-containing protein [Anaerolineae bacterium]|nr:adenylate/guanylate cyclase domain-containing protein [Anaerolineae bacterium]